LRFCALAAAAAAATVAALGCNGKRPITRTPLVDSAPVTEGDIGGRLVRELELEVLASYDREKLDFVAANSAIDPSVGFTVIGVGPGDVRTRTSPDDRWPIFKVADEPVRVVSRRLELFLSVDQTVGWSYDDISLRLEVCGRTASIPLRVAQVYVRDSERWTLVAEHVAYAQPMGRWLDSARGPEGAALPTSIEKQPESNAAQEAIAQLIASDDDRSVWAAQVSTLAIWPDPLHVLRGGTTRSGPPLARTLGDPGDVSISIDGIRLALGPGRNGAIATATLLAKVKRLNAGKDETVEVRLRGTFVVERIGDSWRARFAMVSTPITPGELVARSRGQVAQLVRSDAHVSVQTTCPSTR
jgi:hypothetical protein